MQRFLFLLSRMFAGPLSLLMGPIGFFRDVYSGSGKGRAFLLSLPALAAGFLFLSILVASQVGREQRLTQLYDQKAKEAAERANDLKEDFLKARRLFELELAKKRKFGEAASAGNSSPSGLDGASGSPVAEGQGAGSAVENVRVEDLGPAGVAFREMERQLRAIHDEERLYLRKLMELKPGERSYPYRYSISFLPEEVATSLQLLQALAPLENENGVSAGIGYPEAHLRMAQFYAQRGKTSEQQAQLDLIMVEKHTSQCLAVDAANSEARALRAQALVFRKEYARAYEDYSVLFQESPQYFQQMNELNRLMNRESRSAEVLEQANQKLFERLRLVGDNLAEWEKYWELRAKCMMQLKQFKELQIQLDNEKTGKEELQVRFLDNILEAARRERLSQLLPSAATNPLDADEAMGILEDAAGKEGGLSDGLKHYCALYTRSVPALKDRIAAIYDYRADPAPPTLILIELATDALTEQRYSPAIELLERARGQLPGNPLVLNNLAFAYVMAENANPLRALELVEQAVSVARSNGSNAVELSSYYHTQGMAFLRLNRMEEATNAFTRALEGRPEHEGILEGLIRCYEGRDEIQREVYRRRLEAVKAKNASIENAPR